MSSKFIFLNKVFWLKFYIFFLILTLNWNLKNFNLISQSVSNNSIKSLSLLQHVKLSIIISPQTTSTLIHSTWKRFFPLSSPTTRTWSSSLIQLYRELNIEMKKREEIKYNNSFNKTAYQKLYMPWVSDEVVWVWKLCAVSITEKSNFPCCQLSMKTVKSKEVGMRMLLYDTRKSKEVNNFFLFCNCSQLRAKVNENILEMCGDANVVRFASRLNVESNFVFMSFVWKIERNFLLCWNFELSKFGKIGKTK